MPVFIEENYCTFPCLLTKQKLLRDWAVLPGDTSPPFPLWPVPLSPPEPAPGAARSPGHPGAGHKLDSAPWFAGVSPDPFRVERITHDVRGPPPWAGPHFWQQERPIPYGICPEPCSPHLGCRGHIPDQGRPDQRLPHAWGLSGLAPGRGEGPGAGSPQ